MPELNPNGRLVVPHVAGDQGSGRPLPQNTAVWASPNIRLVTRTDKPKYMNVAEWDRDENKWDGVVHVGTAYFLLVRVFNRGDFATEPRGERTALKGISMEGWVSNFAAGPIGPVSQIDPPPDPEHGDTAFSGSFAGVLEPGSEVVVASDGFWVPQTGDVEKYNDGHVCVGVNVYSRGGDPIGGGSGEVHLLDAAETYPADGKALLARPVTNKLDLLSDTHHGQRNISIDSKPLGQRLVRKVLVEVPATDRCPLEAEVALRPVALRTGSAEAAGIATALGLNDHECPPDPLENVSIDDCGEPSHEVGVYLQPGEKRWLTITVEPGEREKPGDIYAFDIITTEESNDKLYGAARMYVAVTADGS
ncbi:hypothetical protein NDR87_03280 [Nocardia sp. CDC159]|uniref:Uncharacterized protein n=1 Tax=Nocardia pulmonis TaxID=2951408 RepID=A0A9X2E2L3_9NOCA|nr:MULTISPECIES: hypothetical protein [Nocardia]MCM6771963.1 hypothetical protein [Nocardia pulmonis]MCM6785379.1 hypothetical protein [Nocardia sp. CDC159]